MREKERTQHGSKLSPIQDLSRRVATAKTYKYFKFKNIERNKVICLSENVNNQSRNKWSKRNPILHVYLYFYLWKICHLIKIVMKAMPVIRTANTWTRIKLEKTTLLSILKHLIGTEIKQAASFFNFIDSISLIYSNPSSFLVNICVGVRSKEQTSCFQSHKSRCIISFGIKTVEYVNNKLPVSSRLCAHEKHMPGVGPFTPQSTLCSTIWKHHLPGASGG